MDVSSFKRWQYLTEDKEMTTGIFNVRIDKGITFGQGATGKRVITYKTKLVDGDTVDLKIGTHTVRVIGITSIGNDKWRGKIQRFDTNTDEFEDLKADQDIEFERCNIFYCEGPRSVQ
jgi:hypothetical protein